MKLQQFSLTNAVVVALVTCGVSMTVFAVSKAGAASPAQGKATAAAVGTNHATGAVYAMTNAIGNNEITVFSRASDGSLTLVQTIATGGGGSGFQRQGIDSLGSQGGLILDKAHQHLFAVNTETQQANNDDCQMGTISSFVVGSDGTLTLAGEVSSGGLFPASLTVDGNQLYVLNAGGPGTTPACGVAPNITGFTVGTDGVLTAIAGSTQPIDPGTCDGGNFGPGFECGQNPPAFPRSPAQIGFTPTGDFIIVTVKSTNTIYVFPRDDDGRPLAPTLYQYSGPNQPTYFGFSFDKNGNLLVAEAFGASATIPAPDAGSVSSFAISRRTGTLTPISASVPNEQTTPCWAVVDPNGHLFVSNNNSDSISSYTIGTDGSLILLDKAAATSVGSGPNDMMLVTDKFNSSFLYANNSGNGTVGAWKVGADGALTPIGTYAGLPANDGAQGLAGYSDSDNSSAAGQLANISTRGLVETGDDVLIGGFILVGNNDSRVLVRALGPSLASQGISSMLQDPTLQLNDANGVVLTNDNWKDSQQADIEATGIPPSNDLESAIVASLPPGAYTAVVRGKDNTTGTALMEIYLLP